MCLNNDRLRGHTRIKDVWQVPSRRSVFNRQPDGAAPFEIGARWPGAGVWSMGEDYESKWEHVTTGMSSRLANTIFQYRRICQEHVLDMTADCIRPSALGG